MHVCRQVTLTRQTPFNGAFNSASLSFTRSVNAAVVSCVHANNDAGEQHRANVDCQTVSTAVSLAPLLLLLLRPFTRELVDWQRLLLHAADVVLSCVFCCFFLIETCFVNCLIVIATFCFIIQYADCICTSLFFGIFYQFKNIITYCFLSFFLDFILY